MKKLHYHLQMVGNITVASLKFAGCLLFILPMALLPQSARQAIDSMVSEADSSWY